MSIAGHPLPIDNLKPIVEDISSLQLGGLGMNATLPLGMTSVAAEKYGDALVSAVVRIQNYNTQFVDRALSVREGLNSDRIALCKQEFVQYFSLFSVFRERLFAPRLADIYWHAFLLHSLPYYEFSMATLGRMKHHVPGSYGESRDDNSKAVALRTAAVFKEVWDVELEISDRPRPSGVLVPYKIECESNGENPPAD